MGDLIQTRIGRASVVIILSILELVKIVPTGTAKTSRELARAADNLVAGGEAEIFTPMYFMIAQKPQS
jgi:sterol 24-C-methyltransferase